MKNHGALVAKFRKFVNVLTAINNNEDFLKEFKDGDVTRSGSLTKVNSLYMARPILIISDKLQYADQKDLAKVIETEIKIFTANYIQAFRILTSIYGKHPSLALNILNTSSTETLDLVMGARDWINANEEVDYVTDLFDNEDSLPISVGFEARGSKPRTNGIQSSKSTRNSSLDKMEQSFIQTFEVDINVKDKAGERTITLPLTVFPRIMFTDSTTLIKNIVGGEKDEGFMSRLEEFRAGGIGFADLVLAGDLISKYKKNKLKNENDVAKLLKGVQLTSAVHDIYNNVNSFAKNYNIYILDIDDKKLIDSEMGSNIFGSKKQTALDAFYAFSMGFVDLQKERLTHIIDNIDGFSVIPFKHMKGSKDDSDMNEIFKNLLVNKQPF